MKPTKSFTGEVINYMKTGRTLTVEIAHAKWGSGKLSTRISELSDKGYVFSKTPKTVKTRYGKLTDIIVYRMTSFPKTNKE